jgi:hypothetical protein
MALPEKIRKLRALTCVSSCESGYQKFSVATRQSGMSGKVLTKLGFRSEDAVYSQSLTGGR